MKCSKIQSQNSGRSAAKCGAGSASGSFYLTDSGVFTGSLYRTSSTDDNLPQPNIVEEELQAADFDASARGADEPQIPTPQ